MAQKTYSSHLQLLSDKRWQALAGFGARPQRVLWASTSTKDPDLPDTHYLGRQAAPDTIDTVAEGRCSHSPIMAAWTRASVAAAERAIAAIADAGIDVDILPNVSSARGRAGSARTGPRSSRDRGEGRKARDQTQSSQAVPKGGDARRARGTAPCSTVAVRDHTETQMATLARADRAERVITPARPAGIHLYPAGRETLQANRAPYPPRPGKAGSAMSSTIITPGAAVGSGAAPARNRPQ
jgi:hypothetical protein